MDAFINSVVALPKQAINIGSVKRELTVKFWDYVNEKSNKVLSYSEDSEYIYVPRQAGLQYVADNDLSLIWETSPGYEAFMDTDPIELWGYQKPWVDSIVLKFQEGESDITAMAATGKGKTVMSLEIMRRLKRTTLVFVDQEFLRDQWIDNAKKFLGLTEDDIGLLQGETHDYEDKTLVIAMVQSLYNKEYSEDLYDYFGLVIFDESHTLGAEQFSRVLGQFTAEYRLAVSATPDRTDALQKVLEFNLGPVKVELKDKHTKSIVRYVEYDGVISWYSNSSPKSGRYINELAEDSRRNALIARVVKYLAETGRPTLVISDRIEQLENIMAICYYLGVSESSMGLITGYRNVWKYAKDPTPPRKPYGLVKDAEYTPVKLQQVNKRIPASELSAMKETAKIIFSTYGKFGKGVDVSRLSAGVDCTPRAKAQQIHGRILRREEGKMVPLWVTIRDIMSYKAEWQFSKRLLEYSKSNAEIIQWQLGKGTRKKEIKTLIQEATIRIQKLKQAETVINVDGNYTVVTRSTARKPSNEVETHTGRRTQRKKR